MERTTKNTVVYEEGGVTLEITTKTNWRGGTSTDSYYLATEDEDLWLTPVEFAGLKAIFAALLGSEE